MERDFEQAFFCEAVNISSNGLLLRTAETIMPGQIVKSYIDWPARLDNRVNLYLVVEGPFVRRAGDCIAIHIEKYEFRIRGAGVAAGSIVAFAPTTP